MQQKVMKLAAAVFCGSLVTAAYACYTNTTEDCVNKGDTASLVITCSGGTGTAGSYTFTQTQTASAEDFRQVTDYAAVPTKSGPNYWSHATTKPCPMVWDYLDCKGQLQPVENLTSYFTPTLAQDCTQP